MTGNIDRASFIARGTFAPDDNAAIFDKWFTSRPSHFLRYALRRYALHRKSVVDVGSGYGHALRLFGPGSYGLDISPKSTAFANAVGLTTHQLDAERGDLTCLPHVDGVWCRDVLEHVDSPHVLLRKLWYLLKDDGLAFIVVPMVNGLRFLRHIPALHRRTAGYLAADHRNFFTPATMRLTCERAGYRITELTAAIPVLGRLADITPLNLCAPSMLAVIAKDPDWDYASKSTRRAAPNLVGYEYRDPYSKGGITH
jgi:SAM-dependent methyltransferase